LKTRRGLGSQPKIRRYKKIYNKTPLRPIWIILFIIGLVGVFFLSWSLYQPIMDFFSGSLGSSSEEESTDESLHLSETEPSSSRSEPEYVPLPEGGPEDSIRAVYMPVAFLYDSGRLNDFMQFLETNALNYIMLDIKTPEGYVTYASSLASLRSSAAMTEDAITNMADAVSLLHAQGIGVIARISVFRDPIGSRSDYDRAVHYLGSNLFWLDDSKENGGKTWLNPCSPKARNYVLDIAEEVAAMGFDSIIFDELRFPGRLGSDYTDYGVPVSEDTKADYLSVFVSEALERLGGYGTQIYFGSPAVDSISGDVFPYGVQPVRIAKEGYAPTLYPSEFDGSLTARKAVETQLRRLADYISPDTDGALAFLPILQAFGGYGADEISQQIEALAESGYYSYILFAPDGEYSLAG